MTEWLRSYSQCGEDVLLWRALKGIAKGFYIDIGAYDPSEDSVTRIFYDAGWRGINIEPNPAMHLRLSQKRPRDINLDIAVSDRNDRLELNVIGDTGLTTLFPRIADLHQAEGWEISKVTVATRRLDDIWQSHVPPGQEVHFLKIDAEGAETQVIESADWARHRPWIVIVEAVEPNSITPSHGPWEPILLAAGYVFVNFDGLNRYYVDKAHPEVMDILRPPLNFATDRYWPAPVHRAQDEAARLSARCDLLQGEIDRITAELAEARDLLARRPRPFWEKIGFTETGAPRRLLRWLLFDAADRPRDLFRDRVLLPDGRPHVAFHDWMKRVAARKDPDAIWGPGADPDLALRHSQTLSAHAARIKARLQAAANTG